MPKRTYTDNTPLEYQEEEPPNVWGMLLLVLIGLIYIAVTSPFWGPPALWRMIQKRITSPA